MNYLSEIKIQEDVSCIFEFSKDNIFTCFIVKGLKKDEEIDFISN